MKIINMFPILFFTFLSLFLVTQANAYESHHLSNHEDWSVKVEVYNDNSMSCASYTSNHDSIFDMTITSKGDVYLYILFDNSETSINGKTLPFDLVITGGLFTERWKMDYVRFTPQGGIFLFEDIITAVEFMVDVQQGNSIYLTPPDQTKAISTWSLTGSRDAITALFDCYRKIASTSL